MQLLYFFPGFAPCRAVDRRWRRSHPEPSTRTWCSPAWHRLDGPVAQFSRDMAIAWISLISIHSWVANPLRCFRVIVFETAKRSKSYPEIPRAVQKQSWHPKKEQEPELTHDATPRPGSVHSQDVASLRPQRRHAIHFHSFLYDFNWFYMFNQSNHIATPQKKPPDKSHDDIISINPAWYVIFPWLSGLPCNQRACNTTLASVAGSNWGAGYPLAPEHRVMLDSNWSTVYHWSTVSSQHPCHGSFFLLLFRSIEIQLSDLLDTLGWLTRTPMFCYSTFQNSKSDFWILEIPCTGL